MLLLRVQRVLLRFFLWLAVGKYENYGLQKPDHKVCALLPACFAACPPACLCLTFVDLGSCG
jgi:hypothetical protein